MKTSPHFLWVRGFALLLLSVFVPSGFAATSTWDGGDSNNNWTKGNNWNPNGAPANDGTVDIIMAGTTRLSPNVNNAWDIKSLTFDSTAGSFTLGGSRLTIEAGGITQNSANSQTINNAITLGASQSWTANSGSLTMGAAIDTNGNTLTIDGANNITITRAITNSGSLVKNGSGTLSLSGSGDNTFTGSTTINAGTIDLGKTDALKNTSGITVNSGGTLLFSGSSTDRIGNSIGISLNGGTISASDKTETMGTLTLSADSVINLSSGGSAGTLTFANGSYTSGTLTINNWTGTFGQAGTDDRIFFTSNPGATFLSQVQFTGFAKGAYRLSTGELVPAPEPATAFAGAMMVGLLARHLARRKKS